MGSTLHIHVCLCYNVPAGSSREAMVESNIIDRLLNYVAELNDKCSIMICGDLNARMSDMKDYVLKMLPITHARSPMTTSRIEN